MSSRLILVLGDLFIPDRAIDIPAKFKKLLTPNKIGTTLCLGNLISPSVLQYLHSLSPTVELVRGDFDLLEPSSNVPFTRVVNHGNLRIGMVHGHTIVPQGDADALLIVARQLDVDVLLWGGTHRFEAWEMEGRFFVNPGSATGAVSFGWEGGLGRIGDDSVPWAEGKNDGNDEDSIVPSFTLMDVQGDTLVVYVYQLKRDQSNEENVGVEKVTFKKSTAGAS